MDTGAASASDATSKWLREHMTQPQGGPPLTVQELILDCFRRYGSRTLLVERGECATYSEVKSSVFGVVDAISERSEYQDAVAILLPNSRVYVESILACALSGRVRVPLNARDPGSEIAERLRQSRAAIVITDESHWEGVAPYLTGRENLSVMMSRDFPGPQAASGGPAVLPMVERGACYRLAFTGGTTGAPKAVVQTDRQELAMIRNLSMSVLPGGGDFTFLAATPLSHASGAFILPVILGGGSLSWLEAFEASLLARVGGLAGDRAVYTFLVPTALSDLCEEDELPENLHVIYGGAPCPERTLSRAIAALGGRLTQVYGQAEAPMTICYLSEQEHSAGLVEGEGCVGYPFPYVRVRAERGGSEVERGAVGELTVEAEHVMSGYLDSVDETEEKLSEGRLITGDLARLDEHGRYWLVGRTREVIISGGYNVYPTDVENRLGDLPRVREQSVFGVPHERWGEAVVLAIVPEVRDDFDEIREEVMAHANKVLAAYERPKAVVTLESLPASSLGKVERSTLSTQFRTLFEGERG